MYAAQVVAGEALMLCRQAAWSSGQPINYIPIIKIASVCHSCKDAPLHS